MTRKPAFEAGKVIRETVREAQELLSRLAFCQYVQDIRALNRRATVQYPQSLGELCIELQHDSLSNFARDQDTVEIAYEWRRDIQDLRRAMYGRHLPPTIDWGDGLTTPHNPVVCRDHQCPIHGNPTWYVDQSRPRNNTDEGYYPASARPISAKGAGNTQKTGNTKPPIPY